VEHAHDISVLGDAVKNLQDGVAQLAAQLAAQIAAAQNGIVPVSAPVVGPQPQRSLVDLPHPSVASTHSADTANQQALLLAGLTFLRRQLKDHICEPRVYGEARTETLRLFAEAYSSTTNHKVRKALVGEIGLLLQLVDNDGLGFSPEELSFKTSLAVKSAQLKPTHNSAHGGK
jgi:hypothetical protein